MEAVTGVQKKTPQNFGGFFFGPLEKVERKKMEAVTGVHKKKNPKYFWGGCMDLSL